MKLYLEKRGCDFTAEDAARTKSDLGNYRLYLEFIDREGRRITGDVSRCDIREACKGGRGYRVVSEDGLSQHLCREDHKGCWGYRIDADFTPTPMYTRADVLRLVNAASAVLYDGVEIVDELPAAAHDYPDAVLALEREYLAREHAALYQETADLIRENFLRWKSGVRWALSQMTPDEYKQLTLLAFGLMAQKYGVAVDVNKSEKRLLRAAYLGREMAKHLFEEQKIIDPAADPVFLRDVYALCPYGVGQYVQAMAPDALADLCAR